MSKVILKLNHERPDLVGPPYIFWSTTLDAPTSHRMTREQMLFVLSADRYAASCNTGRIERADASGTSEYGGHIDGMLCFWRSAEDDVHKDFYALRTKLWHKTDPNDEYPMLLARNELRGLAGDVEWVAHRLRETLAIAPLHSVESETLVDLLRSCLALLEEVTP